MTLRGPVVATLALALAAPTLGRAAEFSTTNLQVLQGFSFHDASNGNNTDSGKMTTITLNTFSTWAYGDFFFFADLLQGHFKAPAPPDAQIYAEAHPRLFVNKLVGTKEPLFGVLRNWGLAGEVNIGSGFYAYLAGVGVDFALPAPFNVGLNVYYRYDKFAGDQWQVSPFWNLPFTLGPVPLLLSGFVDINGTKDAAGNAGVEVMAQPEVLVDVLALAGGPANRIYLGVEWYWHRVPGLITSSLQPMVQWTVF